MPPHRYYKYLRFKHFISINFMKSLAVKGASNIAPFVAAGTVAFFSAVIGFGFYHGAFHFNGNSTHCHAEGVCHNH